MSKAIFTRLKKYENLLYYVSASLLPSIYLFNLYYNNYTKSNIFLSHVLILAAILTIAGFSLFFIIKFSTGSIEGAFLLSFFSWICFWFFEDILRLITRIFPNTRRLILLFLIVVCIIVITIVIRRFKSSFAKIKPFFITYAIFCLILFVYYTIPVSSYMITLYHGKIFSDGDFHRHEFVIDENLPSPDILWWHVDGMLNLETTERYWDVDMNYIRDELRSRGFIIYEDAFLNAGFTFAAMPALLSPEFYDNFWKEVLDKKAEETEYRYLGNSRTALLVLINALAKAGLTYETDIIPNYELLNAFDSRGYLVESQWSQSRFSPGAGNRINEPEYFLGIWHSSVFMDLPDLLGQNIPLKIDHFLTYKRFPKDTDRLDTEYGALANLSLRMDKWRRPEDVLNTVNYFDGDIMDDTYPLVLKESMTRLLGHLDSYIENNPNIVIVLQSDHGLRHHRILLRLLDIGYTLDEVLELNHSVFSAVRIPPEYGGLDAPIHPLNITRELVNRFVGKNYELLP